MHCLEVKYQVYSLKSRQIGDKELDTAQGEPPKPQGRSKNHV